MAIILMRHGKPDRQSSSRLTALAMAEWCEQYDLSLVCDLPPARSEMIARQADYVIVSSLPRAQSSLEKLQMQPQEISPLFAEVDLPIIAFPRWRLPPFLWLSVLRALWFCGVSGRVESYRDASQRAHQAADRLIERSHSGTVLLVGHGIMNKMIARELRRRGWQAEKHASSRHWSTAIYNRPFI
ncbi:histidine phosphatase family protein [Duffyella gerundensis]|uniref:histidine phosphatase family protein n=1 Tax=Duffyella gerundensis TaxID=1619313 RepID=UPI0021F72493|nr:histidine phosphatase family protein [Duffyella gerundensis]